MDHGGRLPALDGLRGVAILLVLLGHSHILATGGVTGVTLFFTLSGYLITGLLLAERDRAGRVDLAAFYGRRAVRLLPALALVFLAVAVLFHDRPLLLQSVAAGLLFLGNQVPLAGPIHHLWSLGVEEQFYLLWPALLLLCLRRYSRAGLQCVALALAAGSVAWRLVDFALHGYPHAYHSTMTNAAGLLVGAALALRPWRSPRHAPLLGAVLLTLAAAGPVAWSFMSPWDIWVGPVAVAGSALLLAAMANGGLAQRWPRWLRQLGVISYGVYLWHVPVIYAPGISALPYPWRGLVGSVVAVLIAALSWRLVEQPLIRWNKRRREVGRLGTPQPVRGGPAKIGPVGGEAVLAG
jgi:peptidoglycan/LPS O-acetylase OafA/YrhL